MTSELGRFGPSPEDLLYLLEVSRAGRVTTAATRLGLDHTTVSRRISRLEKQVGERLFDKRSTGWTLNETGLRLRLYAEEIESSMISAAHSLSTTDTTYSGSVRIVAPDGFGTYLLPPALTLLHERHPELTIEVVTADSHVSLTSRGFDVAITLEVPPARSVWSRILTNYRLGLYCSVDFLDSHGPIPDRASIPANSLIYYVEDRLDIAPLRILDKILPGVSARMQFNNITGQINAVLASNGIGLLPTYIGDVEPRMVRILADEISIERCYWIAAPSELIRTPRTRALIDMLSGLDTLTLGFDLRNHHAPEREP